MSWHGIKSNRADMKNDADRNLLSEAELSLAFKTHSQKWKNVPRIYIQCKGRPAETYFKFELYERPSNVKNFNSKCDRSLRRGGVS